MATATSSKRSKLTPVDPPSPQLSRLHDLQVTNTDKLEAKTEIAIIKIEGTTVEEYNRAVAAKKNAEESINKLRPILLRDGVEAVFDFNCAPGCANQVTSVKIQDLKVMPDPKDLTKRKTITVAGEIVRLSFTEKYNNCDTEQVDAAFDSFPGRNINDFVTETVKAVFDDGIFLDEKGDFDREVFTKYRDAIARVTRELAPTNKQLQNPDGTPKNVLDTKKVLTVKDGFHQLRFKKFDVEENRTLFRVLPNTVQLVPQRTK